MFGGAVFRVALRLCDGPCQIRTACQQPFTQLKACNIQPVHTSATPTKAIKPCCSPSCLQLSSFRAVKLKGSDETERPSNNIGCWGEEIKFRTIVEQPRRQDGAPRTNDGLNRASPSPSPSNYSASLPYSKPVI